MVYYVKKKSTYCVFLKKWYEILLYETAFLCLFLIRMNIGRAHGK